MGYVRDSQVIEWNDYTGRNMYGCAPCPRCRGTHRAPYKRDGVSAFQYQICCDDCGYREFGLHSSDLLAGAVELRSNLEELKAFVEAHNGKT